MEKLLSRTFLIRCLTMFFIVAAPDLIVQNPLVERAKREKWSIWSLKGGIQTLSDRLHEVLVQRGVNIKTQTKCTSVDFKADGTVSVSWPNGDCTVDQVISALPAQQIAGVLPECCASLAAELKKIEATTVAVVNLEYEGHVVPVQGFGYLVPSCEPLQILGIVFDSCAFPQNDRPHNQTCRITVSAAFSIQTQYFVSCLCHAFYTVNALSS